MTTMDLLELTDKHQVTREEAADILRQVADTLSRHNEVQFMRNGMQVRVDVPKQVSVEIELEIESDESSLEIEINW